ncbi:uncharacterized protein LOC136029013 [Artemia franciscana]|uniref:uncharacterized protein LOC136029013 n=1 Tax=Artemia franciscana TaxID=6661 RepID=UPI0032DBD7F0
MSGKAISFCLEILFFYWFFVNTLSAKDNSGIRNIPSFRSEYSSWSDEKGNFWIAGGASNVFSFNDIWHYNGSIWEKIYDLDTEPHRSHPNISNGTILCATEQILALSFSKKEINRTEIWVFNGKSWTSYLCLSGIQSSVCPYTKAVFTVCDSSNMRFLFIDETDINSVKRKIWSFDMKLTSWQQERNYLIGVQPRFTECIRRWNSVDGTALSCGTKIFWLDLSLLKWYEIMDLPLQENCIIFLVKYNEFLLMMFSKDGRLQLGIKSLVMGTFQVINSEMSVADGFILSLEERNFVIPGIISNSIKLNISNRVVVRVQYSKDRGLKSIFKFDNQLSSKSKYHKDDHSPQEFYTRFFFISGILALFCFTSVTLFTYVYYCKSFSCRSSNSFVRYTAIKHETFLH